MEDSHWRGFGLSEDERLAIWLDALLKSAPDLRPSRGVDKETRKGAQTQRSLENFNIGNDKMPKELIYSFAIQKKAAAISNIALGNLNSRLGKQIIKVCDEIISGKLDDQFPNLQLLFLKFLPMISISEVKGVMPQANAHHHDEKEHNNEL